MAGRGLPQRRRLAARSGRTRTGSAAGTRSPAAGAQPPAAGRGCRRRSLSRRRRTRSAAACRGAAGRRTSTRPAPISTSLPAYITPIRSTNWAIRPMSWPISITAAPSRSCTSRSVCIDLALHDHVERAGRLVGDDHRRAAARSPSRCTRAASCRRSARAGRGRTTVGSEPDRARAARRCARSSRLATAAARASWMRVDDLVADAHHRVERVHRALRDQRDVAPADLPEAALAQRGEHPRPSSRIDPPTIRPAAGSGAGWPSRSSSCREPDSPTRPRRSPARTWKLTPLTATAVPAAVR